MWELKISRLSVNTSQSGSYDWIHDIYMIYDINQLVLDNPLFKWTAVDV